VTPDNSTLYLDGEFFNKGIGTTGNNSIEYALDGKYHTFASVVGIDNRNGRKDQPAVRFSVSVSDDEKTWSEVAKTENLSYGQTQQLVANIQGKKFLKLTTQGNDHSFSDWANARVSQKASPCLVVEDVTLSAPFAQGKTTTVTVDLANLGLKQSEKTTVQLTSRSPFTKVISSKGNAAATLAAGKKSTATFKIAVAEKAPFDARLPISLVVKNAQGDRVVRKLEFFLPRASFALKFAGGAQINPNDSNRINLAPKVKTTLKVSITNSAKVASSDNTILGVFMMKRSDGNEKFVQINKAFDKVGRIEAGATKEGSVEITVLDGWNVENAFDLFFTISDGRSEIVKMKKRCSLLKSKVRVSYIDTKLEGSGAPKLSAGKTSQVRYLLHNDGQLVSVPGTVTFEAVGENAQLVTLTNATSELKPVEPGATTEFSYGIKVAANTPANTVIELKRKIVVGPKTMERSEFFITESVSLSDLPIAKAKIGYAQVHRDESIFRGPVAIGKQIWKKGVTLHAHSELTYKLDGQYSTMTGFVGVGETAGEGGSIKF